MKVRMHAVASAAYTRVAQHRDGTDGTPRVDVKKYGALAHKLPSMILQNGLAQTTGFLLAKGKPEHCALLEDLRAVLHATETTVAGDREGLHKEIVSSDLDRILILTRASLEAGGWLKRYAQGVLGVDATGERTASAPSSGGG